MSDLQRPEAGDPILQTWAKGVVDTLRDQRLASNEYFDIKTTENGTVITPKKIKRKRTMAIPFSGMPSRFFVARNLGQTWTYSDDPAEMSVLIYPLGYAEPNFVFTEGEEVGYGMLSANVNEMVDGDPIYTGNTIIAIDTNTTISVDIEEEL